MSVWEFNAATGGVVKANSTDDEKGLTPTEAKSLASFIDAPPVWQ
jgi:hypothetical protein